VPVSRPRKKKSPRPKSVQRGAKLLARQEQQAARPEEPDDLSDLIEALNGMGSQRRQLDARRMKIAAERADGLLPELLALAAGPGEADFEDALCDRLGTLMYELAKAGSVEEYVNPNQVFEAVLTASADRVGHALSSLGTSTGTDIDAEPDGWRPAWLLLSTLAGIASDPHDVRARDLVAALRKRLGGDLLPELAAPSVAGPALWTCDGYGSRFAIIVPFDTVEGSQRWYLWDIDACGYGHFTVYSGYFPDADDALAAWEDGVGPVASAECALAPVDDAGLALRLLPTDLGMLEPGGESAEQFAEYHRCRRLADTLREYLGRPAYAPEPPMPDPAEYARQFTEWRAQRHGDDTQPPSEPDDVVAELAHNWCDEEVREIRAGTCSPHRVAYFASHIRDSYDEDFANQLMALLPDWVAWWTESLGLPADLAARCQPYAHGAPHPALDSDGSGLNLLARIEE
jgi:hypothetical protein